MKRHLSIILTLTLTLSMWADKVYFVNDQNWTTVKAYCWADGGNTKNAAWPGQTMTKETSITCTKGEVWSLELNRTYESIIFNCGGDNCKTGDLFLNENEPYWYQEQSYASIQDIESAVDPVPYVDYIPSVPDQCPDVMLQAFYWDSYQNKGYGDTKWTTLNAQANEIANYFSLVWLPPSAFAGDDGGLGYHPKQYSNQSSFMGNAMELRNLISTLHDNNAKVLADIVINHAGNKSSWCDFYIQTFGTYGNFQPQASWICKNDEVNSSTSAGSCKGAATGANDEGTNWAGARDWDHQNSQVRDMFKAYLKWLKNSIGYDGWRYDVSLGYKTARTHEYNMDSEAYFSVMEYWMDDVAAVKRAIDGAKKNSLAFDFGLRAAALKGGLKNNTYGRLKNAGLRGQGYSKYAVTFIDNHDTFNRGQDNVDVGNKRDGSSINDASLILQANAYILAMPGVPCVFYPHWIKYKAEIKEMVKARWIAGVHSESTVTSEESGSNYYKATIVGKTGEIRLLLGAGSGYETTPAGYTRAYSGNNCGVYYKGTGAWPREGTTAIETVEQPAAQLQLHRDQPMFNILGQQVDASYKGIVIQNGHKFMLR